MTALACSKKHQCQIRTCRLSSILTVLYLKKKQGLLLDSHYMEICFTLICICVICFTLIYICSICVIENKSLIFLLY